MPIRTGADKDKIYRSFDFGKLVSLHMLDTRLIGRDEQIDIAALAGLQGAEARNTALAAFSSPTRQLLGTEQLQWLQGQMAASTATWQVLGQQVLMGRMEFPVSVLAAGARPISSAKAMPLGRKRVAPPIVNRTPSVSSTCEVLFLINDMVFFTRFRRTDLAGANAANLSETFTVRANYW